MVKRLLTVWLTLAALAALLTAGAAYPTDSPRLGFDSQARITPRPISEAEAHHAVWNLPEVQQRAEALRKLGVRSFTMTTSAPDPSANPGTPGAAYLIYFGEDDGDHISNLGTFSVDAFTGRVAPHDITLVGTTP